MYKNNNNINNTLTVNNELLIHGYHLHVDMCLSPSIIIIVTSVYPMSTIRQYKILGASYNMYFTRGLSGGQIKSIINI